MLSTKTAIYVKYTMIQRKIQCDKAVVLDKAKMGCQKK